MQSQFAMQHRPNAPLANPAVDENYILQGLNLRDPDEIIAYKQGETSYAVNCREYARNDGESRVSIRTRMGASYLSTPIGETANISNTNAGSADYPISNVISGTGSQTSVATTAIGQPFTANARGALTRLDLELKAIGTGSGHVLIEIYTDNGGKPGTLIAESSILSNQITGAYNGSFY